MKMKPPLKILLLFILYRVDNTTALCDTWATDPVSCVKQYNIEWDHLLPDTPTTWVNTMPIGNGVVGANVYTDGVSKVSLLLSSQEAWNEASQLIKLGTVDITYTPSPPQGSTFKQTLDISTGTVQISIGDLSVSIWVDAHSNTFMVNHTSSVRSYNVGYYITLARPEEVDGYKGPVECLTYDISKDVKIQTRSGDAFYHRNEANFHGQDYFRNMVDGQNLGEDAFNSIPNHLSNRTSGGLVTTDGSLVRITVLTSVTTSVQAWTDEIENLVQTPVKSLHDGWWKGFWSRSHLETSDFNVSRQYILHRYLQGCQARAPVPIKFNGMIYTALKPPQTDYRIWGGRNWWQNLRMPYYNMLPAGDFEMFKTVLDSFLATMPQVRATTQHYYNITGVFWYEFTDALYGTTHARAYGCDRAGKLSNPPYWYMEDRWNHYNFQGSLDLSLFTIDYYYYTNDDKYLEIASEVLDFYRQFRTLRDSNGRMVLYPSQALETWECPGYPPDPENCVTNDMPTVAGLRSVVEKMLGTAWGSDENRKNWADLKQILPEVPTGSGKLQPCQICPNTTGNVENAELYAVHPYRLYTAGKGNGNASVAVEAFNTKRFTTDYGWNQNIMDAALLGMAQQAQEYAVSRASVGAAPGYRFPGFMPNMQDFAPSADHLSVMNNALSYMVLQSDDSPGQKLTLLPAWPCSWDLAFKLHGPLNTTVTGTVVQGKINYSVEPPSRALDVSLVPCQ